MFYDAEVENIRVGTDDVDHMDGAALERFFDSVTAPYAATDEKHDLVKWEAVPVGASARGAGGSRWGKSSTSARCIASWWG